MSRHVAALAGAGVDAALWCPTPGFRYTWFDERVPMWSGTELALADDDVLVWPEPVVLPGRDPAPGCRKVIFNQNHFQTFSLWDDDISYPGWSPAPAVWTVSEESVAVLGRAHPELPLMLVPNAIDTDLFRPRDRNDPTIAWMPRKRAEEAALIKRMLQHDPRGAGVKFQEISNCTEAEVAAALGEASVFIGLGGMIGEGFGLPIAEALASGCLVAGYPAGGGEELFGAPSAWSVPEYRPALLAAKALELLDLPGQDALRAAGRRWIEARYTVKAMTEALLAAVRTTRELPGTAGTAVHFAAWMDEVLAKAGGTRATPPTPAGRPE